ncbi:MAG: hypothetical protein AVDCRST_MAG57-3452, partial [uncultured Blastococcus sp.]
DLAAWPAGGGAGVGAGGVRLHRTRRVRAADLHRRRVLRGAAWRLRLDRGGPRGRPGDRHCTGSGHRPGAGVAGGRAGGGGPVRRRHRPAARVRAGGCGLRIGGRVPAGAHAGGGVFRLRHGDRPHPAAAGVRRRQHRHRSVRRRARPLRRRL